MVETLYVWPNHIRFIVRDFARGAFDAPLLLATGASVFLIAYFCFCTYVVFSRRKPCTQIYMIPGFIITAVMLSLKNLVIGDIGGVIPWVFTAAALVVLPTLILCFFGHLVTKEQRGDQRWFITRVAKLICPRFIGKSTGMIIFGAAVVLLGIGFGVISNVTFQPDAGEQSIWINFIAMGTLFSVLGIVDKCR